MQEREIFYRLHPDPTWVHDLETLCFLDVNDAAVSAYGYSREEFLAMQVVALCPAQGAPGFADPSGRAAPGGLGPGTARLVKKPGDIVIAEITTHAIEWHGRHAEMVSARDVTRALQLGQEREAVLAREAGLRRAAEAAATQFERLLSPVPGNMLVLEPGTRTVLAVSDALLESARATRQDILGRALFDPFPDTGGKPCAASMRQMRASLDLVLDTGQPHQPPILCYSVRANDSSPPGVEHRLWLAVNTPVKSTEGAISYVMCTREDVTAIVTGRLVYGAVFEVIGRARKTFHRQDLPYLRTTLDLRSALAMLAEQNVSLRTAKRLIRIGI